MDRATSNNALRMSKCVGMVGGGGVVVEGAKNSDFTQRPGSEQSNILRCAQSPTRCDGGGEIMHPPESDAEKRGRKQRHAITYPI